MERENRYIVIKRKDLKQARDRISKEYGNDCLDGFSLVLQGVEEFREDAGKPPLIAAVVESDWPEYEPVWQMIAERVDG